jgi:hypothetical protein
MGCNLPGNAFSRTTLASDARAHLRVGGADHTKAAPRTARESNRAAHTSAATTPSLENNEQHTVPTSTKVVPRTNPGEN